MIANLRARPIEGHITDSAGNVLRNAQVVIKQPTTTGSFVVDSVQSDDDGYFVSKPINNGVYDIYESGIRVSRIIQQAIGTGIPCYKADSDNFDIGSIKNFQDLAQPPDASTPILNTYRNFIQIEPPYQDTSLYGSLFPIYDIDIHSDPATTDFYDLYYLAEFFQFNSNSRITTTRFDVEYFAPLTAASTSYKRIRWAGVPGIRFYKDSKIVIPLDYYSIIPNLPRYVYPESNDYSTPLDVISNTDGLMVIREKIEGQIITSKIFVGDIIRLKIHTGSIFKGYWYGIIDKIDLSGTLVELIIEEWKTKKAINDDTLPVAGENVKRIFLFDGMFPNIMAINEEINQRFTITENNYAQNGATELYNYGDVSYGSEEVPIE